MSAVQREKKGSCSLIGDCLPADDLKAIVRGEMPTKQLTDSVHHLNECEICQTRLEEIAGASSIASDLAALAEPAEASQLLEQAIKKLEESRTRELASQTLSLIHI